MKLLGITGGIGAGKSAVTKYFADLGAEVIDADAIARKVMEKNGEAYAEVVAVFGEEILQSNGEIDRKKLASIVFSCQDKLQVLNNITHACVFHEMEKRINNSDSELICLDVPLLFSCEFPFQCDKTLAVLAPKEQRIQRVMERNNCSREDIEARMACQLTEEELRKKADICIINDKSMTELGACVKKIYQDLME